MERYIPVAPIHPTQATARLIIVLVSRIQKSGSGDNSFCQMERDVLVRPTEMIRPVKDDYTYLQSWS